MMAARPAEIVSLHAGRGRRVVMSKRNPFRHISVFRGHDDVERRRQQP